MAQSYSTLGGTGYRVGIFDIVDDFSHGSGRSPMLMFNGDTGDNFWFVAQTVAGKTMEFIFNGSNSPRIMDGIKITTDSGGKGDPTFAIDGSNDGSTWDELTTFVADSNVVQEHTWTNTTAYKRYRLRGVSGSLSDNPYWREIEFRLDELDPAAYGNRSSIITVSSDLGVWSGTFGALVDGDLSGGTGYLQINSFQTSGYIQFDFDHDVIITAVYALSSASAAGGDWKWQRYDFGASSWVDITGTIAWAAAGGNTTFADGENHFDLGANSTASSRYRIMLTGGASSSNQVVIREFQFMIVGGGAPAEVDLAADFDDDTAMSAALQVTFDEINLLGDFDDDTALALLLHVPGPLFTQFDDDSSATAALTVEEVVFDGWNPDDASPGITITDYHRFAETDGGYDGVRSKPFPSSGKFYIELSNIKLESDDDFLGIANALWPLGSDGSNTPLNRVVIRPNFLTSYSGSDWPIGSLEYAPPGGRVVGGLLLPSAQEVNLSDPVHVLKIALDMNRRKVYFAIDAQPFGRTDITNNTITTNEPSLDLGGDDIPAGDISLCARMLVTGDHVKISGKMQQLYPAPTGYTPWDGTSGLTDPLPSEAFDPLAKSPELVLSNANSTATSATTTDDRTGVRSLVRHRLNYMGKFYAEYHDIGFTYTGANPGFIGPANEVWNYAIGDNDSNLHSQTLRASGGLFGVATPFDPPSGHRVRFAVAMDRLKFWWAYDNGAWNPTEAGTQDPETGEGGIGFSVAFTDQSVSWMYLIAAFWEAAETASLAVVEDDFVYSIPAGFAQWNTPDIAPALFATDFDDESELAVDLLLSNGPFAARFDDDAALDATLKVGRLFGADFDDDTALAINLRVANPVALEATFADDTSMSAHLTLPLPIHLAAGFDDDTALDILLTRGIGTQSTQAQVVLFVTGR